MILGMQIGVIVEYIDHQKIVCAVVLDDKNQRPRLLTEANRETKLSPSRFVHMGRQKVDPSIGRQEIVDVLKKTAEKRNSLARDVNTSELWEVLNAEQEWIDLDVMTALCFPNAPTDDHESAVIRALFDNRLYFKFDHDRFLPNTETQVKLLIERREEEEQKATMIEEGARWLEGVLQDANRDLSHTDMGFAQALKSLYLFERNAEDYAVGKGILSGAGITDHSRVFPILVDLGLFDEDENVDLLRLGLPTAFPEPVVRRTRELIEAPPAAETGGIRKDMTALPLMTIDGQGTLDYDDAISIEKKGSQYFLGIHIIDVGHYVKKDDPIDVEACSRGSSIYMPDAKIPMLPPQLAEDLCSLKASEVKPAISVMVMLSSTGDVLDFEVVPSIIRVEAQLTYYDVNLVADEDQSILMLRDIAHHLRKNRLDRGAVQISLPDINVVLDPRNGVVVSAINRDSPARVIVEELMILANGLMARFLSENDMPAVFRSQPDPRERLYKGNNGTLYQNYTQRKMLSRFVLGSTAERHAGLGMDAYVTATSPIRKYFDIVTQRQIRAVFGMGSAYSTADVDHFLQVLEQPMANVMGTQMRRKRYWLLKHLESKVGEKYQAVVLYRRRDAYQVLIPDYMLECTLSAPPGHSLNREDIVRVTLQHVNARNNSLSVFWA